MMMAQQQQRPASGGLRRRQAIPLAIGSIAGSGILFLPSAVYVEAGRNSLLVWALAMLVGVGVLLIALAANLAGVPAPPRECSRSAAGRWWPWRSCC